MEKEFREYDKIADKFFHNQYYEGMFGSLTHNILLMLGQIEANLEYTEQNPTEDLEFIKKRIDEVIKKLNEK